MDQADPVLHGGHDRDQLPSYHVDPRIVLAAEQSVQGTKPWCEHEPTIATFQTMLSEAIHNYSPTSDTLGPQFWVVLEIMPESNFNRVMASDDIPARLIRAHWFAIGIMFDRSMQRSSTFLQHASVYHVAKWVSAFCDGLLADGQIAEASRWPRAVVTAILTHRRDHGHVSWIDLWNLMDSQPHLFL
jgi:hypothetical protein